MHRPPTTVLVAGLLFLASAVYGLLTGTLGLELFEYGSSRVYVVLVALVHVYVGLGLWTRDGFARGLAIWLCAAGFLGSFAALFSVIHGGSVSFGAIAPNVVNVFVVSYFAWHLSGSGALAYTGGGHGEHEHGDHAHGGGSH